MTEKLYLGLFTLSEKVTSKCIGFKFVARDEIENIHGPVNVKSSVLINTFDVIVVYGIAILFPPNKTEPIPAWLVVDNKLTTAPRRSTTPLIIQDSPKNPQSVDPD